MAACAWVLGSSTQCLCALPVHQRTAAEGVLRKVQEQPEAWTRVDRILELSKNQQTKFFALQARPHACGACMALLLPPLLRASTAAPERTLPKRAAACIAPTAPTTIFFEGCCYDLPDRPSPHQLLRSC